METKREKNVHTQKSGARATIKNHGELVCRNYDHACDILSPYGLQVSVRISFENHNILEFHFLIFIAQKSVARNKMYFFFGANVIKVSL